MTTRTELLEKAAGLGLQFPKNISTVKLEQLVVSSLEQEVAPPEVPVEELPVEVTATKDEEEVIEPDSVVENKKPSKLTLLELQRKRIIQAKEEAFTTRIVTITNKDNRENDEVTTVYLSFENQHFGLSKLVPLDVPVELEQGLISIAEATTITLHKNQIINGKSTGNKVPVQVKKFAVSYSNLKTKD